jgi:hypothetical protein
MEVETTGVRHGAEVKSMCAPHGPPVLHPKPRAHPIVRLPGAPGSL